MKILWLSPNLNHYKALFLNRLSKDSDIDLTVLAGTGREGKGDEYREINPHYKLIKLNITKAKFGFSRKIRYELRNNFINYDWVLIPKSKKNLLLFLYGLQLRNKAKRQGKIVRLISYDHPILVSKSGKSALIDIFLTHFFYKYYDRIIFYTEQSCKYMVRRGFIKEHKAFWANNTIDTSEVEKYYQFSYPSPDEPTLLFIGRLVPYKNIEVCLRYYTTLEYMFHKMGRKLKLIIIGDGPERHKVENALKTDPTIEWAGVLIDEKKIAPLMKRASLVFVPGHSGLSINHALCYGRPYFTLYRKNHPPEISYLEDNKNGFILKDTESANIKKMYDFLTKENKYIYDSAFESGKKLSVANWCLKIKEAFITK